MRFFAIIGGFWLLVAARKVKVDAGGFSAEMHDHAEELTNSFEQITDNFKLDEEVLRTRRRHDHRRHRRAATAT